MMESMTTRLQTIFPAVAAFHAAAADRYATDPKGTVALFDACHAGSLGRSLATDGGLDHFLFTLAHDDDRSTLAAWLPQDGYVEADRADACLASTESLRRPSDVAVKTACHRVGTPRVSGESLVADLAEMSDIVTTFSPAPRLAI
jgi:hypothetical protein